MAKKPQIISPRKYKNLGGKSVVSTYKIKKDSVTIRFADHSVYIFSNQSAGRLNVDKMKELAVAGKGLGTFITTTLKDRFARKVR